jgi:hypothetical protein
VACAIASPPASPYGHAMHSLTFLIQQQLIRDVIAYSGRIDLHVIPPLCPLAVSSADFGHARELIDRARVAAGSVPVLARPSARRGARAGRSGAFEHRFSDQIAGEGPGVQRRRN